MNRLNRRRHDRLPSSALVALRWRGESGETRFGRGTVLDYSEQGLSVELSEPVELHSFVLVAPQGQNRKACAGKIRYCVGKQTKYIAGVEFGQPSDAHTGHPNVFEVLQNPQLSMLMFRP